MNFLFALLFSLFIAGSALALDIPPLKSLVTDLAGMFPPASLEDLDQRLRRFKTETANDVVVLTVKSLDGEDIQQFARATFAALPLDDAQRRRSVLLVVARKERQVAFHAGSQLQALLPEPVASEKLQAQVALYWDGLRPDLGIHGAVHYLLRVIRGDIRVGSQTEEEKLEETSSRGREAGAIRRAGLPPQNVRRLPCATCHPGARSRGWGSRGGGRYARCGVLPIGADWTDTMAAPITCQTCVSYHEDGD